MSHVLKLLAATINIAMRCLFGVQPLARLHQDVNNMLSKAWLRHATSDVGPHASIARLCASFLLCNGATLSSGHLAGDSNKLTDHLSRDPLFPILLFSPISDLSSTPHRLPRPCGWFRCLRPSSPGFSLCWRRCPCKRDLLLRSEEVQHKLEQVGRVHRVPRPPGAPTLLLPGQRSSQPPQHLWLRVCRLGPPLPSQWRPQVQTHQTRVHQDRRMPRGRGLPHTEPLEPLFRDRTDKWHVYIDQILAGFGKDDPPVKHQKALSPLVFCRIAANRKTPLSCAVG